MNLEVKDQEVKDQTSSLESESRSFRLLGRELSGRINRSENPILFSIAFSLPRNKFLSLS